VLLEAVRDAGRGTRVFVAASGAIFGAAPESPQREETPCWPETPYASAKLAAHQMVGHLRSHDGVFACSGILYNHESERRGESFVTRKITHAAAAIKIGQAVDVTLGDVSAVRDWSFAGDMMLGAWLMLQQEEPADYILASGIGHTVAEFAEHAFAYVGLSAADHVRFDPSLRRAPEVTPRVGDARRARQRLGWRPSLSFERLIERMVEADLRALQT
jgi:GDPmannose 4,6-dehydratase